MKDTKENGPSQPLKVVFFRQKTAARRLTVVDALSRLPHTQENVALFRQLAPQTLASMIPAKEKERVDARLAESLLRYFDESRLSLFLPRARELPSGRAKEQLLESFLLLMGPGDVERISQEIRRVPERESESRP